MRIWRKWRDPRQKPPFGAQIDWSDPITEGLYACFLLNENVGSKTFDKSKYERIGEISDGGKWQAGGVYLGYSSANYPCIVSEPIDLLSKERFSIVSRFTCNASGGNNRYLLRLSSSRDGTDVRIYWVEYNPYLHVIVRVDYISVSFDGQKTINDGKVHDGILVRKGDPGVYLYIDGELDNYDDSTSIGTKYTDRNAYLGGDSGPGDVNNWLGTLFHFYFFERALTDSEIERLHYEPYSFFLAPFPWFMVDLGEEPSLKYLTVDLLWNNFTDAQLEALYRIKTETKADVSWAVFNSREKSIDWKVFTEDGREVVFKILDEKDIDFRYKILASKEEGLVYKIFTSDKRTFPYLVKTEKDYSLPWKVFASSALKGLWNVFNEKGVELEWAILSEGELAVTLEWAVFNEAGQKYQYRIKAGEELESLYAIYTDREIDFAYRVLTEQERNLPWKIKSTKDVDTIWNVFTEGDLTTKWLIYKEDDLSAIWRVLSEGGLSVTLSWRVFEEAGLSAIYRILRSNELDSGWKVFIVDDVECIWNILEEKGLSGEWKIFSSNDVDFYWKVITSDIPKPLFVFKDRPCKFITNSRLKLIILSKRD